MRTVRKINVAKDIYHSNNLEAAGVHLPIVFLQRMSVDIGLSSFLV